MEKVKKQVKIILWCMVMYIFNFLIAPFVFVDWYPNTNESSFILAILTFCITFIGTLKVSGCMFYWLIGDILYCLMIVIYHPAGAYGIGQSGIFPPISYTHETHIIKLIVQFIFVVLVQIVAVTVGTIIKVVRKMMMKDSDGTMQR